MNAPPQVSEALVGQGITVQFDGLRALSDVDLVLNPREILGLIGPNGAGKTTLVNVLSGYVKPTRGRVLLEGRDVTGTTPSTRVRKGLARSFQGTRLFRALTVLENVEAGVLARGVGRSQARGRALSLLARFGLEGRVKQRAGLLPAGDQRRLGVARALAVEPRFLLLDEPAAGLNEVESGELVDTIRTIRDEFGCAILVIDHDMRVIMPLCERIQALSFGRTIAIAAPEAIRSDPAVIAAYLGSQEEGVR